MRTAIALIASAVAGILPATASAATEPEPLALSLELHVEGVQGSLAVQAGAIREISDGASEAGIPISAGMATRIMSWRGAPALVRSLLIDGHAVTLHADLGNGTEAEMTADLEALVRRLAAIGGDPTVASGVCTASDGWVEAAMAAGIELVAGVVEYCGKSLDPAGAHAEVYAATAHCRDWSVCHDPLPTEQAERLWPWQTDDTSNWLSDTGSGVTIAASYPGIPFDCLGEGEGVAPSTCRARTTADAEADAAGFAAMVVDALADRSSVAEGGGVLTLTWSVGRLPSDEYAAAVFGLINAALADAGVDDEVAWTTLPNLVRT